METFRELKINPAISQAIAELGYTKPSPIQAQALPILLGAVTDFIGLAATGTGKTAAFGIPLLEKINPEDRTVQALVLCPTRELSLQVAGQINLLGKNLGIRALSIYGGAGYGEQLRGLREGMQVVIGTPGRLIDHLERGTLNLDSVKVVVLDEADEMISMGFREDMETILEKTPRDNSNIWLFSATMSPSVRRVADLFLKKPKMVQVNRTEMLSATVEQSYFMTAEKNKPELLCKLIDAAEDFFGLIFCQTKVLVMELTDYLSERGYKVDCLHGDMSQADREIAMTKFRAKRTKILVCTDVAARGLDVKDVSHVINFSIPRELDSYVHRIGRTARSGKTGYAMSFVTSSHRHLLDKIERMTKSRIVEGVVPSRKAIASKKISTVLKTLLEQKNYPKALDIMDQDWKKAVVDMGAEEVAARFLNIMLPELFAEQVRPNMLRADSSNSRNSDRLERREGRDNRENRKFNDQRRDQQNNRAFRDRSRSRQDRPNSNIAPEEGSDRRLDRRSSDQRGTNKQKPDIDPRRSATRQKVQAGRGQRRSGSRAVIN